MPKKSNKGNLSIDKMLEQAKVIPENEPYKVPKNWCWVYLESINQFISRSVNPISETNKLFELYSVPSSQENYPEIIRGGDIGSTKQSVKKDDVLLCKINPRINRVWIVSKYTENTLIASSEWIVVRNSHISPKYLMWCMRSPYFREYMLSNVSGIGGSLMRAKPEHVKKYPIALAPLSEQYRIVEHIETMFSKLDEAKEKAQEILDSYNLKIATILYKAFSGELTSKWRKEHKIGLNSWEEKSINDLCHSLKYGTAKKSKTEGSVVVVRMGNLQQGEIDWSDLAYSDDIEDIKKYKLSPGDVLFNRTNSAALVGKTSIYRGDYPAIYAGYLIKLDYDRELIIGDYLNYALNTIKAKEYCNTVKTDGVNQSNINAKKIGAFKIPVPSIKEQQEIVKIVGVLLDKEKETKYVAEYVIEQIDLMKKSILIRAFRGELGTNNPKDEKAEELLKRILIGEKHAN